MHYDTSKYVHTSNSVASEFKLKTIYFKEKDNFANWTSKFNKCYQQSIISTSKKLFSNSNSLSEIKKFILNSTISKKSSSVSFRVFLNYCDENELLNQQELDSARKTIKLHNKTRIDSYVPNKEKIDHSLKKVLDKYNKKEYYLYKLLLISGERFTEIENMIITYDKAKIEYHDDIASYSNFYLRGNKNSFYIFFIKKVIEKVLSYDYNAKYFRSFKKKILSNEDIVNIKYLRKYNFTLMIKQGINFEIANFIQGRSSKDVGFNHYLAKKEIAAKEYKKILEFIDKIV